MVDAVTREAEQRRYAEVYQEHTYRMRPNRRADTVRALADVPRGSLLDVSCGRGEMLAEARALGFLPVHGTEIVPGLIDGVTVVHAEAHALPFGDKSFDVVTLFDVIEHLFPGDDRACCGELIRVARRHVLITTSNRPSMWLGADLHVNKRRYAVWDRLFREWFPGRVTWLNQRAPFVSQTWRVDL